MAKTFTMREIAQIKRTAQNVAPMVTKKEKLMNKISELQLEVACLDKQIDAWEVAVKAMTNGFTSSDLINRVVKESVSEDGKVTKTVTYELKFPESVVPALQAVEFEAPCRIPNGEVYAESDAPMTCDAGTDGNIEEIFNN